MRQAEHDMQTSSCRPGFNPENNPEHEARLRKYEMRRQKYVKKLEDAGFEVPVFVQYDMEEKHLHVTYPEYSSESDTDEEDNPMLTSQLAFTAITGVQPSITGVHTGITAAFAHVNN